MVHKRLPALRELHFGYLDAKEEAASAPDLLEAGFFDHKEAALRAAQGDAWLLVGPKGSGKSAALEHLALKWQNSPMHFMSLWYLGGWPVADVSQIKMGINSGDASAQGAWELLLLLRVFESLMRDHGASMDPRVDRLHRELVRHGLVGDVDLRTRFVDWTASTAKFGLGGVGLEGARTDTTATLFQVSAVLREALSKIHTSSRHLIAIDGLDQFFAETDGEWRSLAGMIHALQAVNLFLAKIGLRANVAAAIRSDIFSLLPSTDSAKLIDHSIYMSWSEAGLGDDNQLWTLINQKALASIRDGFNTRPFSELRKDYFPAEIHISGAFSLSHYFLLHTRLQPRDLIALLAKVQEEHPGATPVTAEEAKSAVRKYSEQYFLAEVRNNLHGLLPNGGGQKVAVFMEALAGLEYDTFEASDLRPEIGQVLNDEELRKLLRRMYDIGAIAVLTGKPGRKYTHFSYREVAGASFRFAGGFRVHAALTLAWKLQRAT